MIIGLIYIDSLSSLGYVITWTHYLNYWPFAMESTSCRWIPSTYGQLCGALRVSLLFAWVSFCIICLVTGLVFCLLLGGSSDYAQPITGHVTEVTCPVIGRAQPELTPSKRQKTGPGEVSDVSLMICSHGSCKYWQYQAILTHWGRDQMAAIFQTTFSNGFSWMKMYEFRLTFHWRLFLGFNFNNVPTLVQVMAWLRPGDKLFHLNQWWLDYRRIYASLSLNELTHLPLGKMAIISQVASSEALEWKVLYFV